VHQYLYFVLENTIKKLVNARVALRDTFYKQVNVFIQLWVLIQHVNTTVLEDFAINVHLDFSY
jgi:hypothetical protein